MVHSFKEVFVAGYGVKVYVRNGMVIVKDSNGNKAEFAPREIDCLIIGSSGVSVTSKVIRVLMDAGADIVFLDSHGLPIGHVYPPYINRTVYTRISQYESHFNRFYEQLAKIIVYSKIANQAGYMKYLARKYMDDAYRDTYYEILDIVKEIDELEDLELDELRRELIVIEAKAARLYWSAIAYYLPDDICFNTRDQAGSDQFNISLNYLYGILYKEAWKALVLAGLDPYLGYVHVERSGRPVLVYDFVEMFRVSCVDYPLSYAFYKGLRVDVDEKRLSYRSRMDLVGIFKKNFDRKISFNRGDRMRLEKALKKTAFELASCLRDKRAFKGFIEDW